MKIKKTKTNETVNLNSYITLLQRKNVCRVLIMTSQIDNIDTFFYIHTNVYRHVLAKHWIDFKIVLIQTFFYWWFRDFL